MFLSQLTSIKKKSKKPVDEDEGDDEEQVLLAPHAVRDEQVLGDLVAVGPGQHR